MAAEIISLSKARKARDKQKAAKISSENRVKFGRSKAQKAIEALQEEIRNRRLDLAKRNARNDADPDDK